MLSICSSAISCPSTYPQKTLSTGLFLSKAAGFINHMTTIFKKKCIKEKHTSIYIYIYINTINIKLLHKPTTNAKKRHFMPWPANKKPKVLVHHTAYPRIPRPPPSSSAVVAASYGRRGVCPRQRPGSQVPLPLGKMGATLGLVPGPSCLTFAKEPFKRGNDIPYTQEIPTNHQKSGADGVDY